MSLSFLYVPTDSQESAKLMARTLLEEKLVACVNIIPAISSFYWWEGEIDEASEVVMIIKLDQKNVDKTRRRVMDLHPYSIPCIAEFKVDTINSQFHDWALKQD